MPNNRRFPPPWSVEDIGAAFVVKDSSGQKLGYFYYEEEPGRRSAAKMLSPKTRHAGWQSILPRCLSFCGSRELESWATLESKKLAPTASWGQ
jgi:hypothetical protein